MEQAVISVNSMLFWIFAALTIVAMRLLSGNAKRRYVQAAINLGFIGLLVHGLVIHVAVAIMVFYSLLRLMADTKLRQILMALTLGWVLIFFIVNKTGGALAVNLPPGLPPLLAAVGFSFVALRAIEVIRAVNEQNDSTPDAIDLVNYLVPFHMLAAGPIQAYDDFRRPAEVPALDRAAALSGAEAIANGLFKKFVLAFAVQRIFLNDFDSTGIHLLVESMFFLFWLYLDFSAYSDIALGIGKLAGISTPENFRNPLAARNLVDFWDRWHISLSLFIRRNIFIPIQLNLMRSSREFDPVLIASVATSVSFLLCGLWHGLTWGWLGWGAMHAAGLVAVRVYGNWLTKRFTPQQMVAYRQSRVAGLAATLLTYTYVSAAFLPVFLIGKGS